MNDTEVEIEVAEAPAMPMEMPGMPGGMGMIDLSDMMSKAFGKKQTKRRKLKVPRSVGQAGRRGKRKSVSTRTMSPAWPAERGDERHRLPGRDRQDRGQRRARRLVSREGVQRDLLP
jgi:ATP-dependent HslUV protease ATP-binding subunit HslU